MAVETGSLHVEAELLFRFQPGHQVGQLLRRGDGMVFVRRVGYRMVACREIFEEGRLLCGLGRRARRGHRIAEQVALYGEVGTLRRGVRSVLFRRGAAGSRPFHCLGERRGTRPLHLAQEHPEIQLLVDIPQRVAVGVFHDEFFRDKCDGYVRFDCGEPLGKQQLFPTGQDVFLLFPLEGIGMRQDVFHRAEFVYQLHGTLLPDAGDTRNVVCRIAPECQDVDDQPRVVDAVLLAELLAADDLHAFAVAALFVDVDVAVDELSEILVGRHHVDLETLSGGFAGERADHVVGFVAGDLEAGNAHRFEDAFDVRNGRHDVFRRFVSVSLVLRIEFVAEGSSLGVEGDAHVTRRLLHQDVPQKLGEAEYRRGVDALPVAHGSPHEGVIRPVYQGVCVE